MLGTQTTSNLYPYRNDSSKTTKGNGHIRYGKLYRSVFSFDTYLVIKAHSNRTILKYYKF